MDTRLLPMDVDTVAIDAVTPHPDNPRRGDRAAVMSSLRTNGQYRPIVVQRSTGHIIAGNNTCAAARELGWDTIAVQYVDVDDRAAKRIMLADNRTSDLADYDDDTLASVLAELGQADMLDGTGFSGADLADALRTLSAAAPGDPSGSDPAPMPPAPAPDPTRTDRAAPAPPAPPSREAEPAPTASAAAPPPPSAPASATFAVAMPSEDRAEAVQLTEVARKALGVDVTPGEAVLRALRTLVAATDARHVPDASITVAQLLLAASRGQLNGHPQ